jgi:tetratricopeptide (TPR) repeat protein
MIDLGRLSVALVLVLAPAAVLSPALRAQQGWPPDSAVNLQVLPKDIPIRDLIETMRGFAGALGVRCTHCHVGDDPQDLRSIDFPSDEKIEKKKAREMIRMRDRINGELLAALPERSDPPVVVECATCHHGLEKPADLRDVLAAKVEEGGAEAAIAEYERLREEYYGSWSYDFREFALINVAERTADRHPDEALALLDYNLTLFPESVMTYVGEAEILADRGDIDGALARLREAERMQPDAAWIERRIRRLEAARGQE